MNRIWIVVHGRWHVSTVGTREGGMDALNAGDVENEQTLNRIQG